MAKTKHTDPDGKKQKTFHVYLTNGKEIEIKAARFQAIADDFQIHFFDGNGNALADTYIARNEVAVIVLE